MNIVGNSQLEIIAFNFLKNLEFRKYERYLLPEEFVGSQGSCLRTRKYTVLHSYVL